MTLAAVLCTSGTTGVTGIKSVYAAENDSSKLKSEELSLLKDEISEVIEKYHTPKSEIKDEVLNTVKNDVESYAKEKNIEDVSWAWIDYDYTREWDFYTLDTHADFDGDQNDVYAELYPENGKYSIYYLLIGKEVIVNRRDELPGQLWQQPESVVDKASGIDLFTMTEEALENLKEDVSDELKENHKPESGIKDAVLDLVKENIEEFYSNKGYEVSWAWFDYDYTREWNLYTLTTPINYKNDQDSGDALVYAEAYPIDSEYALVYLSSGDDIILDKRESLPDVIAEINMIEAATENIEDDTEYDEENVSENIIETDESLTVENCPEFAAMLGNQSEFDPSYSDFAEKYKGRKIEFDGRIDYCTNYENYNTRFDYLVSAGDYDPDSQIGPVFKFENVNYYDWNTDMDTVSVGTNVHIIAEVESFDSNSGLFYLDPVSVIQR